MKFHPASPEGRFADLQLQGFMKNVYAKPRKQPAPPKPVVTCHACENWHTQGKHTAPIEIRRANLAKLKARTALGKMLVR